LKHTALSLLALAVLGAITAVATPSVPSPPPAGPPSFVGGIHVTEHDLDAYADALLAAGLDSLQITVYAAQPLWDSAEIRFDPSAESDITSLARAARRAGLTSVLVLRVYLQHGATANQHLWHGMIWPPDNQLDRWFARYRTFATWAADLAEREGIDVLVVGNELNSMTSTIPVTELPDSLEYFLDPARQARVRQDLLACAISSADPAFADDLRWADGTRYDDLEAALGSADALRHQWARRVLFPDDPRAPLGEHARAGAVTRLNRRRAALEAGWRDTITASRALYSGAIAYGANFDQYQEVGFWDAVDAVGVTAYFPLSRYGDAGKDLDDRLDTAWRGVARDLRAVSDKPIYMLELGWTRRRGATVRPWSYGRVDVLETNRPPPKEGAAIPLECVHWASQPRADDERRRALASLRRVVEAGDFPGLRGVHLWKLSTDPAHADIEPFAVVLGDPLDADYLESAAALGVALRTRPDPFHPPPEPLH